MLTVVKLQIKEFVKQEDVGSVKMAKKKLDIKKAIKKPGSLTAAAKRKGMTIAQYCKNPPSKKAGYRCRFAKTLKKIAKKRKKK